MEINGADKSIKKNPTDIPVGLFDRIIGAIKREKEFKNTKKILILFFVFLIVSCIAAPFSSLVFFHQMKNSGLMSFLSMISTDFFSVLSSWKEFGLALLESIPIIGIIVFVLNIALALFTIRLFLRKKQFLLRYLIHNLNNKKLI